MFPPGFLFVSSFLARHICLPPMSRFSKSLQGTFYFLLSKSTKTADPGRVTTRIIIIGDTTVRICIRHSESTRLWLGIGVIRREFRMRYSGSTRQSHMRRFRFVPIIKVNEIRSETPRIGEGRDRISPWRIIVVRTEARVICGSKRSKD